jgi:hypothetical protein
MRPGAAPDPAASTTTRVIGKYPAREPIPLGGGILLAPGLPEKLPVDGRDFHWRYFSKQLLRPRAGQFAGLSASAVTQITQAGLQPGALRPLPILTRQPVAVIGTIIDPTLAKY